AAGAEPKFTPVAAEKPVPVIVTLVPPEAGPLVGATDVTRATGTNPSASRRNSLRDWLYTSFPKASNAENAGPSVTPAAGTTYVTPAPVKSQVTLAEAVYVVV